MSKAEGKNCMSTSTAPTGTIPRLMTPDDVATMLGLTRVQVIRQSRAGKLPAIHIGKCYRYRLESLQAWFDKQEQAA